MKQGYAPVKDEVAGMIRTSTVGYISDYDIKIAMKVLPAYFKEKSTSD